MVFLKQRHTGARTPPVAASESCESHLALDVLKRIIISKEKRSLQPKKLTETDHLRKKRFERFVCCIVIYKHNLLVP